MSQWQQMPSHQRQLPHTILLLARGNHNHSTSSVKGHSKCFYLPNYLSKLGIFFLQADTEGLSYNYSVPCFFRQSLQWALVCSQVFDAKLSPSWFCHAQAQLLLCQVQHSQPAALPCTRAGAASTLQGAVGTLFSAILHDSVLLQAGNFFGYIFFFTE